MILMLFSVFFPLLLIGVPIAFSMVISCIPVLLYKPTIPYSMIIQTTFFTMDSFILMAIPLFIFAGVIMEHSGIALNLVNAAKAMIGFVRGGLALTVILGEMFFSGISGSSAADASAIGSLLLPSLSKAGYKKSYSVSLVAAASAMGILIPPCNSMVILGAIGGIPVGALFMGGFLPATVMAILIGILVSYQAHKNKFPKEEIPSLKGYFLIIARSLIPFGMIGIIFGGILTGVFTPTEAAGVAVVYAIFVGLFIYRSITFSQLYKLAIEAAALSGLVMILVGVSAAFSYLMAVAKVPEFVSNMILAISPTKWFFLIVVSLVFIFLGSILEGAGALIIFVPIFVPLLHRLNVDPIHFGIVLVAALGIGLFLPPMGVGLLITCGIGKVSVHDVIKDYLIFLVILGVGLTFIIFFPWITLFVPKILGVK